MCLPNVCDRLRHWDVGLPWHFICFGCIALVNECVLHVLYTILYVQFQGGGSDVVSVRCFGVRVSVMFHFMFVHYTFSSVWFAEWPPFGK